MRIAGRCLTTFCRLSAFTDPLTGEPLKISATDREALDNPKLETPGPEQAYGLLHPSAGRISQHRQEEGKPWRTTKYWVRMHWQF